MKNIIKIFAISAVVFFAALCAFAMSLNAGNKSSSESQKAQTADYLYCIRMNKNGIACLYRCRDSKMIKAYERTSKNLGVRENQLLQRGIFIKTESQLQRAEIDFNLR